jgi:hypothetical protein
VNVGARSATRFHFCRRQGSPGRRNRRGDSKSEDKRIWPTSDATWYATVSLWRMKSGSAPRPVAASS